MARQEQVLIIEPQHELKFTGPFSSPVTSYITLTNPSEKRVCFKIKTTAPKQYCVRPNSGVLDAKSNVEIAVSLQPQTSDFPTHENSKHKFMVQTMFAPDGEFEFDHDKTFKETNPENLMDSKLKCVFESGTTENASAIAAPAEGDTGAEKKVKPAKVNTLKASPKVGTQVEGELVRAAAEVKSLREEESSLRQENLMLKEEVLRLRRAATTSSVNEPKEIYSDVSSGVSTQLDTIPPLYLIIAFICLLMGVILGKFLL